MTGALRVNIWRGDAGGGSMAAYRAPRLPNQTVLDVVTWIQRHAAPDLSYRFSCRVGMCGSCAMTVNGAPRWTCRTHVKAVARGGGNRAHLDIAPLRNLPVIKDLVCDMSEFFQKWQRAEGRFHSRHGRHGTRGEHGERGRHAPVARITADDPARAAADAAVECIHCAVCYAACDAVAWNPDYLGPAALNRAWTLVNDARDAAGHARLRAVTAPGRGCQHCHSLHGCARHCPVQLSPARSIAGLKRRATAVALRGELPSPS